MKDKMDPKHKHWLKTPKYHTRKVLEKQKPKTLIEFGKSISQGIVKSILETWNIEKDKE